MITGRDILLYLTVKYKSNWEEIMDAIHRRENIDQKELDQIKAECKYDFISLIDDDYPEFLKKISKPPFLLFYKGNVSLIKNPGKHNIAIVGSRKCSKYGISATQTIVNQFPRDYVVISGLAKGIDVTSHKAALEHGLLTVGIIGSGFDSFYPKENEAVAQEIINKDGLILTEYYQDVEAKPDNFVHRNRIIAGLCDFLLVAEAYEKSGTTITVNFALAFGKEVGCIPYEIDKKSICNNLIKEGAYLIDSSIDIEKILK